MPRLTTETFGAGDQSWLGSSHGIHECRTETLDISAFTAGTHYPNGYIPSGTPVAKVGGLLVPYDSTEATVAGAGVLAGFLFTDQRVVGTGDFAVPLLDHGRVKAAKVPTGANAFTAPVAAAKRAATTVVYI
ncbi:MAG TPA: hypothetical protein VGF17_17030 [Phytomonospora sp.]